MARAAGASRSPSDSIGNGSAGGNSRISGRGASDVTSCALAMMARTRSPDIKPLHRLYRWFGREHVRHVRVGIGRHCDAHAPTLGEPPLTSIACGALANAGLVMVGADEDMCCFGREYQRANATFR